MIDAFRQSLTHELHRQLYDYWRRIAPPGALPGRRHFDPTEVPKLLPYLYLRDVVRENGDIRFRTRLMGTKLVDVLGRDTTGKFMEDVFDPVYVARQREYYLEIVRSKAPDLRHIRAPVEDKEHVRYDRLLLPFAADGETVDLLTGIFAFVR